MSGSHQETVIAMAQMMVRAQAPDGRLTREMIAGIVDQVLGIQPLDIARMRSPSTFSNFWRKPGSLRTARRYSWKRGSAGERLGSMATLSATRKTLSICLPPSTKMRTFR